MLKSKPRFFALMSSIAMACLLGQQVLAQEGRPDGPRPDGMGPDGPQQEAPFDPDNPPKPPVPPVKPKPLEPDMGWLNTRKQLMDLYDGIIDAQFSDMRTASKPTQNPLLQQFREYWSEKNIVSEWSRTRPQGNDWTYPVPETHEAIKEIEEAMNRELEEEAVKAYPLLTHDEYVLEGEKLYALYKIGDQVEFNLRRMLRGNSSKVRGRVRAIQKDRVIIEPRKVVVRVDMPKEVAARFFYDDHVAMVKEHAENATTMCRLNRSNYVHLQFLKRMPERLLAANYVQDHIRFGSSLTHKIFKIEQWVSRKYLVMERQRQLWEANIGPRSIGERTFNAFMNNQGYSFVTPEYSVTLGQALRQDETNRHVGWVPKADIALMLQTIKKMEEYAALYEQYKTDLEKYKRDKAEFDRRLKEYQAAGGQVNGDDEDEE